MFLVAVLFMLALTPPGRAPDTYTVYVYVSLDGDPVNGANVTVTLLDNGISDQAVQYGTDGAYAVNLGNDPYAGHWEHGDPVGADVRYEVDGDCYEAADTASIDTQEGYTYFNLSLEPCPTHRCPAAPMDPSPADGAANVSRNPSLSVDASDPDGDAMTIHFYDDATGDLIDSVSLSGNGTATVTWQDLDYGSTYSWYAAATDEYCSTVVTSSSWQFTTVSNSPPGTPSLSGPSSGQVDSSYTFTAAADDPNGDDVSYLFDWGDGGTSGWTGLHSSGEEVSVSHTWGSPGSYEVQVKARDADGKQSQWSDTLTVSIVQEYTLSTTATPPEGGTISLDPPGGRYEAGTSVTVTATPAAGYRFDGWAGALNGSDNPAVVVMDADKSVEACFARNTPPDVTVTSPEPDAYVAGVVTVAGTASDVDGNQTLQHVSIRIDNESWQQTNGSLTDWTYSWDTSSSTDGSHTIAARAYDGDNYSAVAQREVSVDNTPPSSAVGKISPYMQNATPINATVTVGDDGGGVGVGEVRFYYSYSPDNESYSGWQLYRNKTIQWENRYSVPDWHLQFDAPNGTGWYRLTSVAIDRLGNVEGYEVDAEVHLDMGLTLTFGSPQHGTWIAPSTPVTITATGTDAIYYRILNNDSWIPTPGTAHGEEGNFSVYNDTFSLDECGAIEGNTTIQFYGTGTSMQRVSCRVDATPPVSTCTGVPFLHCESMPLNASATDTGSGVASLRLYARYSVDNESWGNWTLQGEADDASHVFSLSGRVGFYRVAVAAVDFTGNVETRAGGQTVRLFSPDINDDGVVNVNDFVRVTSHWQEAPREGTYAIDLNGDGAIDELDLSLVDEHWLR